MAKLTILGSAAAVPDENHENTYMLLQGDHSAVLIDCAGQPLVRIKKAGLRFDGLTDVILTHFHPDHTYGFPILLMGMWLLGRQKPLRVYGLHHCLDRAEDLMGSYHWGEWPDFFPIAFHRLPDRENMPVLDNSDFRITAWPVRHLIPTIGLRVQVKDSGKVLAYSSDTEPCSETVRLAAGADILIHEAAGDDVGHSSAAQAGTIAAEARAKHLLLIHYKVWNTSPADTSALVEQARTTFEGPVELAQDFMEIEL